MPHNLRSTELGFLQRSKHVETAVSTSSKVAKNRLCVAMRRASFQTRSTGASCGLYGGRNSRVSTARYVRSNGLSKTAWWYRALSTTSTMRVSWARCRSRVFRTVSNVATLNVAHRERMNVPVRTLTAPKHATDLRVGAWSRTGSLTSGGTHLRHRVPCCWKWHSSTLQRSTLRRRARRCSVFTQVSAVQAPCHIAPLCNFPSMSLRIVSMTINPPHTARTTVAMTGSTRTTDRDSGRISVGIQPDTDFRMTPPERAWPIGLQKHSRPAPIRIGGCAPRSAAWREEPGP
jgi:hypothetical protein